MTFIDPTYLWALLGILVPVAIHLWSRKKVVTVKIGSTQLLNASEPKRTSTVRPNEWWLLVLRSLIIALLVFMLAGPNLMIKEDRLPLTYIIEPSLLSEPRVERLLDTVPSESKRVMSKNFPYVGDFDASTADVETPKYWQLAQEMQALTTDSIVVFTKALISGIRGMRPSTSANIKWVVIDTDQNTNVIVGASLERDSLSLVAVAGDRKRISFNKSMLPLDAENIEVNVTNDSVRIADQYLPLPVERPLKVLLVGDDSLSNTVRYIKTAYRAISRYLKKPISVERAKDLDTLDWKLYSTIIGLTTTNVSFDTDVVFDESVNCLQYRPDALARDLIVPGPSKNSYYLTGMLNSENVVTEHVTEKLLALLGRHEGLIDKLEPYDHRLADIEELRPRSETREITKRRPVLFDLSLWIWPLLFLIMLTERILAKYRKQ
ncbi:MAG: BatA domain-containing protein [Pricia sp.]